MKPFDFSVFRMLRLKRGLTAEQLAKKAGLTRATVSKIEAGEGNPTLETIAALSDVFQKSASELIRLSEIAQCEQATTQRFQTDGIRGAHIAFPHFEVFHIRARTGVRKLSEPQHHENTAEVCLVLAGRLKLAVADQTYALGPGEAIRFKALQEHRFDILEDAEFLLIHHNWP
jgi:XRE family transcriptional regulator, regulator of sulfur utilization